MAHATNRRQFSVFLFLPLVRQWRQITVAEGDGLITAQRTPPSSVRRRILEASSRFRTLGMFLWRRWLLRTNHTGVMRRI